MVQLTNWPKDYQKAQDCFRTALAIRPEVSVRSCVVLCCLDNHFIGLVVV